MISSRTDWSLVKMGSLGDFRNGVNFTRSKKGSGLRLINVKDLYRDGPYLDFNSLDLVNIGSNRGIENYYVGKGDLFFARSSVKRTGIGQVCMSDRNDNDAVHCGFVIRFRPKPESIDSLFLTYLLRSQDYRKKLISISGGSAIINITQSSLAELELVLPDVPEQRVVSSILSAYDDLIENNRRRIQLLEEMALVLYREWFVHFKFPGHENVEMVDSELGEIPEGWMVVSVSDLYDTASGGTPSRKVREYYGGKIPWVKTRELNNQFILSTEENITDLGLKKSSAKIFPEHTVLIAMYGATIGQTGIITHPSTTNQACCALLPKYEYFDHSYIFIFLQENYDHLMTLRAGAAQQNINQQVIRELSILKPKKQVIKQYTGISCSILENIKMLQIQNVLLRKIRESVLPKLVSGHINVSEMKIENPSDTHKNTKSSDQSTLDQWFDENTEEK